MEDEANLLNMRSKLIKLGEDVSSLLHHQGHYTTNEINGLVEAIHQFLATIPSEYSADFYRENPNISQYCHFFNYWFRPNGETPSGNGFERIVLEEPGIIERMPINRDRMVKEEISDLDATIDQLRDFYPGYWNNHSSMIAQLHPNPLSESLKYKVMSNFLSGDSSPHLGVFVSRRPSLVEINNNRYKQRDTLIWRYLSIVKNVFRDALSNRDIGIINAITENNSLNESLHKLRSEMDHHGRQFDDRCSDLINNLSSLATSFKKATQITTTETDGCHSYNVLNPFLLRQDLPGRVYTKDVMALIDLSQKVSLEIQGNLPQTNYDLFRLLDLTMATDEDIFYEQDFLQRVNRLITEASCSTEAEIVNVASRVIPNFTLEKIIGTGAFKTTYQARDHLQHPYAIKYFDLTQRGEEILERLKLTFEEMLVKDAQNNPTNLKHPNICICHVVEKDQKKEQSWSRKVEYLLKGG